MSLALRYVVINIELHYVFDFHLNIVQDSVTISSRLWGIKVEISNTRLIPCFYSILIQQQNSLMRSDMFSDSLTRNYSLYNCSVSYL